MSNPTVDVGPPVTATQMAEWLRELDLLIQEKRH
jgi:hypothetical protein